MIIDKSATNINHFRRLIRFFKNARTGFFYFLDKLNFEENEIILLPSYIGWSPYEGSGVFDPVSESKLPFEFYKLNDKLHIDMVHLKKILNTYNVKVFVIIHYFGYIDPNYLKIIELVREKGSLILEDQAHSMYTDLIFGSTGRKGDVSIFSLKKMLPINFGGALIANEESEHLINDIEISNESVPSPWQYDLWAIAMKRRNNAELYSQLIQQLSPVIQPFYIDLPDNIVPVAYPIYINTPTREYRDHLYTELNAAGFGVSTLYHTLITPIKYKDFPISHEISNHIMHLPVHQDLGKSQIVKMIYFIESLLTKKTHS